MSTKKKKFEFEEYGTSIYPDGIDILNRLYDAVGGDGPYIEHLLRNIPGFARLWRPDQGDWFWVAEFMAGEVFKVVILIPWCHDWEGNLKLDKSIALCAAGVPEKDYLNVLQKVIDCFWDKYFVFPRHDHERKLPGEILSRTLDDGRKAVPMWYVDVRASLNPVAGGDMFFSHLAARKWFEDQGYLVL